MKKEGLEGLREEVEGVVKATEAVVKIEGLRKIGGMEKGRGGDGVDKVHECEGEAGSDER